VTTAGVPSEDDDATLLAAVATGDGVAFEALYRRHAPWLLVRLRYRCADEALVDDVVQETFLAVWHGTARFRSQETGDFAGWLWRIGSRRLIDALRRRGAGDRLWQRLTRRRIEIEPSAEDLVLVGVEHGDLAGALARLSPELRAVLQATILDGLTTREASILLDIPVGTVKTRAMRARAQLRQELA
jgi:RNA polymerase sigma-70 factor (ECF subfamily)